MRRFDSAGGLVRLFTGSAKPASATALARLSGALHADGYAGFNGLYKTGSIVEVGCWAHVRRKFYDLHHAHASPLAADALRRIGALYAVEAELRGQPAEVRAKGRQARAGPQLEAFRAWLQTTLSQVSQKSALAEAIRYVNRPGFRGGSLV